MEFIGASWGNCPSLPQHRYASDVNPLVALGRRLASNGLLVTFTTTPHADLNKFTSSHHRQHEGGGDHDGGGVLRFEHLREGVWASDNPRYRAHDDLARHLDDVGPAALAALIRRQADAGRPVTFVVANLFTPCTTNDYECTAAWLDAQPPRSVVFATFGSVVTLSRGEMHGGGGGRAGLASTGRPFLWVVRDDDSRGDLLSLPDGGGGRVGKVGPWCEQRRVLSHGAVGCFVTHCGWNSTTEALAAEVPVVAYPVWSDQRTNVGVRLPDSPTGDDLRRCVEEVMGGGLEEEAMRARAREWKAKASAAVAGGGSSSRATQDFDDAVMSIRAGLHKHEDQAKLEAREVLNNTVLHFHQQEAT